jgi:two-component system sensor histidine kinase/response regulator
MKGDLNFNVVVLLLFFLLPTHGQGQQSVEEDSTHISRQQSIALKLYHYNPDSAISIALKTLTTATDRRSNYQQGVSYYILSNAYGIKVDYRLSAEYGFKALQFFENTNHTQLWLESLLLLARINIDLRNYKQARNFIINATTLGEKKDRALIAAIYREYSMLLVEGQQYDSALYYINEGINYYEHVNDTLNLSILYQRKSKILYHNKNFDSSSSYNQKTIAYARAAGDLKTLGIAYYDAALNAMRLNEVNNAILLLNKSVDNHKTSCISTTIEVHSLLANIYLQQKKILLAFNELKIANDCKDRLYDSENYSQIQEMQSKYDFAMQQKTIQNLAEENSVKKDQVKNQQIFLTLLLIGILLLVIMIFLLIRLRMVQGQTNQELINRNIAIEHQKEEILAQAERLQQLNQLKSKLFSVISHDLRGPIANLHALLELITIKSVNPDEFKALSEKLKDNLNITQRTLENLLNWSLSQMEGIKTEPKKINIKSIIDDTCFLLKEVVVKKNIMIEVKISDSINVYADQDQLQVILRNLIHNAIKFSIPSGRVVLSVIHDSTYATVSIKDYGIGMTAEEIEMVTGSKQYFSKSGTLQEKGTGLGLMLCKEFIKRNGGHMEIVSTENSGTEITFSLKLFQE